MTRRRRVVAVVLLLAAVFAAWFILHNVGHYLRFDPEDFGAYFWPRRYGLLLHLSGGVLALCIGIAQLWLGATGQTGRMHRRLGQLYLFSIAIASAGAVYLALTIPPDAWAYSLGLLFLAAAWLLTSSMAYLAIRRRKYEQHREWMIRSYVVTFAFVTFRAFSDILAASGVGTEHDRATAAAWLCWAVPLLLAEPFIQWRKLARAS
jgi:heme/copper-type cytochrome/quinol oxidase subunit 3